MNTRFAQTITFVVAFFFFLNGATAQQKIEKWARFELNFNYSNSKEDFQNINLSAKFFTKDTSFVVSGFYDGNNQFKIRFMPCASGIWNYVTTSNIQALNKKKGSFECVEASGNNYGLVKVSDTYNFKYADGKQYYPFGTTAYAWNHMGKELQQMTLESLKSRVLIKFECVFSRRITIW